MYDLPVCHTGISSFNVKNKPFTEVTSCSHSLHLLIMNDGLNKVPLLKALINHCKNVVPKLHFKGEVANQETARINENLYTPQIVNSLIQKVEGAYSIVSADMNMPLDDEETYPESGEDNTYGSNDERAGRGYS